MRRMRRCVHSDSSTLLAALVTIAAALTLIAIAAAALACPPLKTDRFRRLTAPQSSFCVAAKDVSTPIMLALSTVLSLGSTVWVMSSARRAYTKFLVNGGVSAVFARTLLRELGALAGLLWWLRRLGKEPGSRGMKRLKMAILAASGLLIITTALVHVVIGSCYQAASIRITTHHLRTTSLPAWLDYDNLKAAQWERHADEVSNSSDYRRAACHGNATEIVACELMQPVTYNGMNLGVSYAPNALPASSKGSGLPVLTTINRNAGNETHVMAYIVTDGQLVDTVPEDASDFQLEQELILVQRLCRMTNGEPVPLESLAESMPDGNAVVLWANLSKSLPQHLLPKRRQAQLLGKFTDAYVRPGEATITSSSAPVPTLPGAAANAAVASASAPVREQLAVEFNTTHFIMRTLSLDYGIICRTELLPYRGIFEMSTAVTVPFLAPEDRTRIPFSAATMRLLNASITATHDALKRLEAPYNKADPTLGPLSVFEAPQVDPTLAVLQEAIRTVNAIGAGMDMPTMPLKLSSCYNMNYFASGIADDSCVSTEIDKVFGSYLIELASMDKARWDFPPGTQPVAGGMVQNGMPPSLSPAARAGAAPARGALHGSAGMPSWEWGPVVARTVPNKAAQVCLVVFTVLTVLLLILLHWMTSPLTALTGSDLCPEGFRDATPWMAFADAEHPPEALKDLAGLPVDEAVKHEGSKGIVMGLVQVEVQSPALQDSSGPTAVPGPSQLAASGSSATCKAPTKAPTTKWVFRVEQGWQLWAEWDKFVQAKQAQGDSV